LLHPKKDQKHSNKFDNQIFPEITVLKYKMKIEAKRLFEGVGTKKRPLNFLRGPLTLKTKTNLLTSETI